jgi:hypothetical protein
MSNSPEKNVITDTLIMEYVTPEKESTKTWTKIFFHVYLKFVLADTWGLYNKLHVRGYAYKSIL